jgi:hypothetical protein
MSNESTTAFATAAAKVFLERHPSYVVGSHNADLMSKAILRLVDSEGADPANVSTYERAFQDCLQELELREPEQPKSVEEMTAEELSALPPEKQDRLPSHLLLKVANFDLNKRWKKPEASEHSQFLKETFESEGFAFSPANAKIINDWIEQRGLGFTSANLRLALADCEDKLELSEKVLNEMPADEYRKTVIEREFNQRQKEQPKREQRQPWGVKYTEWLHNS